MLRAFGGGCFGRGSSTTSHPATVPQVEAQSQSLPAEWQFVDNPVACAAIGVEGKKGARKDICWLPPGTVTDLFEQFKASGTLLLKPHLARPPLLLKPRR
jgi:hypothetical protein